MATTTISTNAISASTPLSSVGATGDWTSAGFGTPEAVIMIEGGTASGGGLSANLLEGLALYDGTRIRCISSAAQDAQATSVTSMRTSSTRFLNQKVGQVVGLSATPALITDGVRFTCTTRSSPQVNRWFLLLMKGFSRTYVSSVQASTTVGGTVSIIEPRFRPDALIFLNSPIEFDIDDGTNYDEQLISRGFASRETSGISQGCTSYYDEDNLADTRVTQKISDVYICEQITATSTELYDVQLVSFDPYGFTIKTVAKGGTNCFMGYMALKFDGDHPETKITAYTTGTGNKAISGYGGTVTTLIQSQTVCPAINTNYTAAENAGSLGFGIGWGAAVEAQIAIVSTPNAAATNTGCVWNAPPLGTQLFLNLYQSSDLSTYFQGTLASFDSTGFTVNISLNDNTSTSMQSLSMAFCSGAPPLGSTGNTNVLWMD